MWLSLKWWVTFGFTLHPTPTSTPLLHDADFPCLQTRSHSAGALIVSYLRWCVCKASHKTASPASWWGAKGHGITAVFDTLGARSTRTSQQEFIQSESKYFPHNVPRPLSKLKWKPYCIWHTEEISLTVIVNMLHVKPILFSWPRAELINLIGAEGSVQSCIQGPLQE